MQLSHPRLRNFLTGIIILLFVWAWIPVSLAQKTDAQPSKEARAAAKWEAHMKRMWKDWLYVGVEVIQPQFRYGYKATEPWVGPNFMLIGGLFQASFLKGMAQVQDSGKTYRQKGFMTNVGFNIPIPMVVKRGFELYPLVGFGFNVAALDDRRKRAKDIDIEANQFGFYLKPGLLMKVGPVVATMSYVVSIGGNFTSRNAISPFTHYPSLGLMLNSMPILMNPRDFTAPGKRHYRDLVSVEKVNSGMTYNNIIERGQDYIKYRKETIYWVKSTYSDRFENESIKVKDVKPFTYLGPRISTTYFSNEQFESATNVGLNFGFRYGLWWVNGYGETGDVLVKAPEKAIQMEKLYNSASFPTLSGRFKNSQKFGGQFGIDLVVRSIKKGFSAQYGFKEEAKAATSFTAIIPYVGYGISNLGTFSFGGNTTASDVADFETRSQKVVFKPGSLKTTYAFYNFGLGIHIGAFMFGMDFCIYPDAKNLNGRQIFGGLNLPIARLARAVKVRNYQKKLLKETEKE